MHTRTKVLTAIGVFSLIAVVVLFSLNVYENDIIARLRAQLARDADASDDIVSAMSLDHCGCSTRLATPMQCNRETTWSLSLDPAAEAATLTRSYANGVLTGDIHLTLLNRGVPSAQWQGLYVALEREKFSNEAGNSVGQGANGFRTLSSVAVSRMPDACGRSTSVCFGGNRRVRVNTSDATSTLDVYDEDGTGILDFTAIGPVFEAGSTSCGCNNTTRFLVRYALKVDAAAIPVAGTEVRLNIITTFSTGSVRRGQCAVDFDCSGGITTNENFAYTTQRTIGFDFPAACNDACACTTVAPITTVNVSAEPAFASFQDTVSYTPLVTVDAAPFPATVCVSNTSMTETYPLSASIVCPPGASPYTTTTTASLRLALGPTALCAASIVTDAALVREQVCNATAVVPTPAPVAVPTPAPEFITAPPGLLCTYTTARMEEPFDNENCPTIPPFLPEALTICQDRTVRLNASCWLSACGTLMTADILGTSPAFFTPSASAYSHIGSLGQLQFRSIGTFDNQTGRLVDMYQKFMIENRPLTPDAAPFTGDLSRWQQLSIFTFRFNSSAFANQSYALTPSDGVYARTLLATFLNWRILLRETDFLNVSVMNLTTRQLVTNHVFLPGQCPNATLGSIPWTAGNDIRLGWVVTASGRFTNVVAYYNSVAFNASDWTAQCAIRMNTDSVSHIPFCAAFPSYYAFDSLANASVLPSPHRDLELMARFFMEEWADCGAPRGCLGYRPESLIPPAPTPAATPVPIPVSSPALVPAPLPVPVPTPAQAPVPLAVLVPAPTPRTLVPVPDFLSLTGRCTFTPEMLEGPFDAVGCPSINTSDSNWRTICVNLYVAGNISCYLSRCAAAVLGSDASTMPAQYSFATSFQSLVFTSIGSIDSPPGRLIELIAKFMIDNRPGINAVDPFTTDLSRWRVLPSTTFQFTDVGFPSRNFSLSPFDGAYARSVTAAYLTYTNLVQARERIGLSDILFFRVFRFLPSQCIDDALASIPWLASNEITVEFAVYGGGRLAELVYYYNSPSFNASNWTAECAARMSVDGVTHIPFCASFPSYYPFEALADGSVRPSPHRDFEIMARTYTEEFAECRPARGCLGYRTVDYFNQPPPSSGTLNPPRIPVYCNWSSLNVNGVCVSCGQPPPSSFYRVENNTCLLINPCDDNNLCTNDFYDQGNGICSYNLTFTPLLSDGSRYTCNPFTGTLAFELNLNQPNLPVVNISTCDDNNPATLDSYDSVNQRCRFDSITNYCDNSIPCTGQSVCTANRCTAIVQDTCVPLDERVLYRNDSVVPRGDLSGRIADYDPGNNELTIRNYCPTDINQCVSAICGEDGVCRTPGSFLGVCGSRECINGIYQIVPDDSKCAPLNSAGFFHTCDSETLRCLKCPITPGISGFFDLSGCVRV